MQHSLVFKNGEKIKVLTGASPTDLQSFILEFSE